MAKLFQTCNLCGGDQTVKAHSDNGEVSLVKCIQCGLVYHDKDYDYTFPHQAGSDNWPTYHLGKAFSVEMFAESEMARIERYLTKPRHKIRLLEIGCGTGSFLKVVKGLGYRTHGIDINKASCAYARGENKLENIYEGSLETLGFSPSSFDCVILRHTFEHITNPRDFLAIIRRILVQHGVVAITVPNYEFITTTLGRCLSKKPFNKVASLICHRGHLYYYMPATMAKFFDGLGFETLEMCYSYAWVPLIEKAKHLEDPLRKKLARLTCLVNDFCENLHLWRNFTGIGRKTSKVRPIEYLKDTVFLKMPETGSWR